MNINNMIRYLLVICILCSCHNGPQPIHFGTDVCNECRMTIVDNHFGGEFITMKGKNYKFDSIECLVNFIRKNNLNDKDMEEILVVDHSVPGTFVKVHDAFFLHSTKLPSPMGAFLSAFASKDSLSSYQLHFEGESLNWNQARSLN